MLTIEKEKPYMEAEMKVLQEEQIRTEQQQCELSEQHHVDCLQ